MYRKLWALVSRMVVWIDGDRYADAWGSQTSLRGLQLRRRAHSSIRRKMSLVASLYLA